MTEYEGLVHDIAQSIIWDDGIRDGINLPRTSVRQGIMDFLLPVDEDQLIADVVKEIDNQESEANEGEPTENPSRDSNEEFVI